MTPPAMTAAGRGTGSARSTTAPGHRRALRRQPATARPRRISGPIRGHAAVAPATARPAAAARVLAVLRSLPEHSLLDRLVRGRAWIPVLGLMLAGIVAMQVEVLKLGTSVGRWMQRAGTLQTKNETLQASVASLADDQRIERLAVGMGMVMPAPTAVSFLPADTGRAVFRALANIHAPDPTGFIANLPAVTAASGTAVQNTPAAAATTSTTGATTTTAAATTTTAGATTTGTTPTATTGTPATTPAAAPSGATGGQTSSQSAAAPASATQTPVTGAAALGPSSPGNSTTSTGG